MAQRGNLSEEQIKLHDVTLNNVSTSKHGLVPKAPNDANKFLDGTGNYSTPAGGSGSGGIYPAFTVPVSADFTWNNQLTTTVTDSANRENFALTTNNTDPNWRLWLSSASLPSHFQITMAFSMPQAPTTSYQDAGIVIRDSTGTKFVFWGVDSNSATFRVRNIRFDSVTTVNTVASTDGLPMGNLLFLRVKDNGTTRSFQFSLDGWDYQTYRSEATGTFITPNQLGMGFAAFNASSLVWVTNVFHFLVESI